MFTKSTSHELGAVVNPSSLQHSLCYMKTHRGCLSDSFQNCRACWDKFNDTVSEVVGYSAQARELHNETYEVGDPVDVGLAQKVHLIDLHLKAKSRSSYGSSASSATQKLCNLLEGTGEKCICPSPKGLYLTNIIL